MSKDIVQETVKLPQKEDLRTQDRKITKQNICAAKTSTVIK